MLPSYNFEKNQKRDNCDIKWTKDIKKRTRNICKFTGYLKATTLDKEGIV